MVGSRIKTKPLETLLPIAFATPEMQSQHSQPTMAFPIQVLTIKHDQIRPLNREAAGKPLGIGQVRPRSIKPEIRGKRTEDHSPTQHRTHPSRLARRVNSNQPAVDLEFNPVPNQDLPHSATANRPLALHRRSLPFQLVERVSFDQSAVDLKVKSTPSLDSPRNAANRSLELLVLHQPLLFRPAKRASFGRPTVDLPIQAKRNRHAILESTPVLEAETHILQIAWERDRISI